MSTAQFFIQLTVTMCYVVGTVLGAVQYFRTVRIARPPIGVFNARDIVLMMGLVVAMPFLYVALPGPVLPTVIAAVFAGGLSLGYRVVIGRTLLLRAGILALLAADLICYFAAGVGSPAYWLVNSCLVGLVVISATNINVQGGVRFKHVAVFSLFLAGYDLVFATVIPLTQQLADEIQRYPFAPAAGLRVGEFGAVIGMGDLLVYALYATAAYKAYGRAGLRTGLIVAALFGAVVPVAFAVLAEVLTGSVPSVVPAQVFFGPAAFVAYLLLRRRGPELRMADHLAPITRTRHGDLRNGEEFADQRDRVPAVPAGSGIV